jgi:hypothetical protein
MVGAMSHHSRRSFAFALVGLIAAATSLAGCGASDPGWPPQQTNFALTPVPVSTQIVVGPNRLLFNILDRQNQSIASADTAVALKFYNLAASKTQAQMETPATYLPTIAGRPGLYRADVSFDAAGDWGVDATSTNPDGTKANGRFVFSVREQGTTPAIGAPAVASDTPTATTPDEIKAISTDDDPDPDFYEQSVADALAAHEPFAVVFATPAFCTSAMCAPTLDMVKTVAADYKDRMTFIHVEPYELKMVDGALQPVTDENNRPIAVPATSEWGLPTEPYIFVVGSNGKVSAKFEGIASADELRAAFDEVARPAS